MTVSADIQKKNAVCFQLTFGVFQHQTWAAFVKPLLREGQ